MRKNVNNDFEQAKIQKVSTNKVVTNVYCDSFEIEKVRFQNYSYENKTFIDCYLGFDDVALLATDLASGRLINILDKQTESYVIYRGGTKHSKNNNGNPESKIMSLTKSGDKIFINMQSGPGVLSKTGLIMPEKGKPLFNKIGVPVTVDDLRKMFIYTRDWVNAYLSTNVSKIVDIAINNRNNN